MGVSLVLRYRLILGFKFFFVYRLAALGSHPNVIRYYNAWLEDGRLFIQTEYCEGGSVAQRVASGGIFDETELCVLFRQMANALEHIHSHQLVHLVCFQC